MVLLFISLKTLLSLIGLYFLYKFIFDFAIPMYKTAGKVKKQMGHVREQMEAAMRQQQQAQQQQNAPKSFTGNSQPNNNSKEYFTDYEDIK
jgi:hypothetical protein